jgi:hypothetical protein
LKSAKKTAKKRVKKSHLKQARVKYDRKQHCRHRERERDWRIVREPSEAELPSEDVQKVIRKQDYRRSLCRA